MSRRRPERNDDGGPDQLQLQLDPRPAGPDVGGGGSLVEPPLSARAPAEVLHDIRDEDLLAIDAGRFERLVEDASGRSDEDVTVDVLAIARLLAREEEPGIPWPLAEDGLCRPFPELARSASGRGEASGRKAGAGGNEIGGMDPIGG